MSTTNPQQLLARDPCQQIGPYLPTDSVELTMTITTTAIATAGVSVRVAATGGNRAFEKPPVSGYRQLVEYWSPPSDLSALSELVVGTGTLTMGLASRAHTYNEINDFLLQDGSHADVKQLAQWAGKWTQGTPAPAGQSYLFQTPEPGAPARLIHLILTVQSGALTSVGWYKSFDPGENKPAFKCPSPSPEPWPWAYVGADATTLTGGYYVLQTLQPMPGGR